MKRLSPSYKTFAKQSHTHTYVYIHTHTFFFKIAPKINHMTTKKKKKKNNTEQLAEGNARVLMPYSPFY